MANVSVVTALVRSLLGDDENVVYTDATQLPTVNSAHRDLQSRLVNRGCRVLVTRTTKDITAGNTSLSTGSSPALPTDFMIPYKLWEKTQGALDSTYQWMRPQSELPDRAQTLQLSDWQYENGQINFVGATQTQTVRIEYERIVPDFTGASDPLPILMSENALAHLTASLLASSRGQRDMARDLQSLAEGAVNELATRFTRGNQFVGTRRRAYGKGF